jgi:RuvB-like protein 2
MAPVLVIATNRGVSQIRGTEYKSPHGIPVDLLDRLMIIPTQQYGIDDMRQIVCVRCKEEEVDVDPAALELLTRIASETSLRYAIHLITIAQLNAKRRKQKVVQIEDVERCYKLFVDVKRSTKLLIDHQKDFMFNDLVANTEESGNNMVEG